MTTNVFTEIDRKQHTRRYMVQVVPLGVLDDVFCCEQLENDALCGAETKRACCICATPTCLEHGRRPAYQPCCIHSVQPSPTEALCCVCITCASLAREVQEHIYHFRRQLNGEGNVDG